MKIQISHSAILCFQIKESTFSSEVCWKRGHWRRVRPLPDVVARLGPAADAERAQG